MATLEVHDGLGRVKFVALAYDHPLLFGSSATCDVVLTGADIRPVHGRIRWRSNRFKIEASPDVEYVLVNGHRAASKSLHQGDEIVIGECRMFLQNVGPKPDSAGDEAEEIIELGEGRTVVLEPPTQPVAPSNAGPPRKDSKPKRPASEQPDEIPETVDHHQAPLVGPTALRLLKKGLNSAESDEVDEQPTAHFGPRGPRDDETVSLRSSRSVAGAAETAAYPRSRDFGPASDVNDKKPAKRKAKGSLGGRIQAIWNRGSAAPGREKILSSPLFIGLVVALVVLVAMGFWLRTVIATTVANRLLDAGISSYEDGDYPTAIRDLDLFRTSNPDDRRVGKARVFRGMANVRQYVSPASTTWTSAKTAVEELVADVGEVPEFSSVRADLAELVIKIGVGLADRAKTNADAESLADAERSVLLHASIAGDAAPAYLTRSTLPTKLTEARASVRKSQTRARALAAMDQALKDKSASGVYDARDDLIDAYSDLSQDRELISRMTAANDLIRKAVTVDRKSRHAERSAHPDVLGPATSLVFRSKLEADGKKPAVVAADSVVYALADGMAYGIDGKSGRPLWQRPAGLGAPFVPQQITGENAAIYFDVRWNELCRVEATTGELAWRIALEERVQDPPLVLGNQLYQVLPSGRLVLIALETGELLATAHVGMPLARTAVSDESGRNLYVMGRQDCLFVMSRERLECEAVEYLGHREGSAACAPVRMGRFLVITLNDTISDGRWKVLLLDQEGVRASQVQEIGINGWTWQAPAFSGQVVWATGDKSGFEAFAAGDFTNPTPLRTIAKQTPDATASGPAYALALSEKELWVSSGHPGKLSLDAERGAIRAESQVAAPGPAAGAIQLGGGRVVMTFVDAVDGGIMLMGLDPETSAEQWRTVVGAEWGRALEYSADRKSLETIGRDGKIVSLNQSRLQAGGFVELAIPKTGELELPNGRRFRVGTSADGRSVLTSTADLGILWVQDATKIGGWRSMQLPAGLAADPLVWAGHLLIPGIDARLYLIDPVTGGSAAEPFVPEYDRGRSGRWYSPALLGEGSVVLADDAGRLRRVANKKTPVARLLVEAETLLDHKIVAAPAATASAVIVALDNGEIRSVAARDFSPVGAWKLEAPLDGAPVGVDGEAFVMDRAGSVLAFGRDGRRNWSVNLGAAVVGNPLADAKSVSFLTRDGKLHVRSRKDGSELASETFGVLPDAGLIEVNGIQYVPSGRGSIRALATPAQRERGGDEPK